MPNTFTPADEAKVKKWMDEKVSSGLRCFACGSMNWAIQSPPAMTVSIDLHTGRVHYMEGYAMIGLMCSHCAHIIWFNAITMGLASLPQPAAAAPN